MQITYSADAHVSPTNIEGYIFERGQTQEIPDAIARQMLSNQHFTGPDGRNDHSCGDCGRPVLEIARTHPGGAVSLRTEGEAPRCIAGCPKDETVVAPVVAVTPLRVPALVAAHVDEDAGAA